MLHALAHAFGLDNLSGPFYGFWSGIGSDLGEITLIGLFITALRHVNCQSKGCWRPGRFPVGDGRYKVCHRHHPEVSGRSVPQAEIDAHHEAHRAA